MKKKNLRKETITEKKKAPEWVVISKAQEEGIVGPIAMVKIILEDGGGGGGTRGVNRGVTEKWLNLIQTRKTRKKKGRETKERHGTVVS